MGSIQSITNVILLVTIQNELLKSILYSTLQGFSHMLYYYIHAAILIFKTTCDPKYQNAVHWEKLNRRCFSWYGSVYHHNCIHTHVGVLRVAGGVLKHLILAVLGPEPFARAQERPIMCMSAIIEYNRPIMMHGCFWWPLINFTWPKKQTKINYLYMLSEPWCVGMW